jgi:hypothetical protein
MGVGGSIYLFGCEDVFTLDYNLKNYLDIKSIRRVHFKL